MIIMKRIILISLVILLGLPLAQACNVGETTYTKTTKIVVNSDCSITTSLYSGTMFVFEV